jgi:hypothetical protein
MARPYSSLDVTPTRQLSEGGYKVCCSVAEFRDKVVLIHPSSEFFSLDEGFTLIEQEQGYLASLAALGLPVAQIGKIGVVEWNGRRSAAHLMKRYSCGNREKGAAQFLRLMNERTINTARRLLSLFEELQPLYIDDLQFLFARDGSFVINDPLFVERRYSTDFRWELERIIKAARYSLCVRRSGTTHRRRAPLWQAAEIWSEDPSK